MRYGLRPRARIVASAAAGVAPRVMGPVPATRKVLKLGSLELEQMDVIKLNEPFASQSLAVLRELGLPDGAANINPKGGAIATGRPRRSLGRPPYASWRFVRSCPMSTACTSLTVRMLGTEKCFERAARKPPAMGCASASIKTISWAIRRVNLRPQLITDGICADFE